jgi:hypothetical protein
MSSTKMPMSKGYKAIFVLSILMIFVVIVGGAISGSKSIGLGIWIWGYTTWLMYKRKNAELVSFYKLLLWFYVIAAVLAVSVLLLSDSDVSLYVGYTATEAVFLFVFIISLTYGLYRFFRNLESNTKSSNSSNVADSFIWDQVTEEVKSGKRVDSLWTRAFSESDGDSNKANARYIKLRFEQIKMESRSSSSHANVSSLPKESNKVKLTIFDFWNHLNTVGKLALIGFLLLVGYGILGGNMDPYFNNSTSSKDVGATSQPSQSVSSEKPIKNIDDVNSICYAFWDGRRWQTGQTEGDNFLRLKMGRYGVHVLTFSLPIQMANEFGLSKESATDVDVFKGEIGKFMNENWYQLEALCNFR